MLKRTTVYLEDTEVQTLKRISFIQSVSMAELIRRGVQELCKTFSKEQKDALATLAEIKADAKVTSKAAMNAALKTQKEVRRERKTGRR
ncbi:MAG: hypothetical protein ACK5P5_13940 [Pseudobdellovibrionaceae bacterium]|jgi:hypothetical protein